jgi:hypothetical protein
MQFNRINPPATSVPEHNTNPQMLTNAAAGDILLVRV